MSEEALQKTSPLNGLAKKFNIEPAKLLEVLRGTVIKPRSDGKPATNEEVAAFCIVAEQYGLNPFLREIHAFSGGDKGIVPIVGIDGWAHLVNAKGDFDGCDFEEERGEGGGPVSVTCKMYVKGRSHPVCATERFAECKRNTPPWNMMPWRMLRHKAYMQAARYAFGLSGIYDEDEARDIIKPIEVSAETVPTVGFAPTRRQLKAAPSAPADTPPPEPPPFDFPPSDSVLVQRKVTSAVPVPNSKPQEWRILFEDGANGFTQDEKLAAASVKGAVVPVQIVQDENDNGEIRMVIHRWQPVAVDSSLFPPTASGKKKVKGD